MTQEQTRFQEALQCDNVNVVSPLVLDSLPWLIMPHISTLEYNEGCSASDTMNNQQHQHGVCSTIIKHYLSSLLRDYKVFSPPYPPMYLDICSVPDAIFSLWCQNMIATLAKANPAQYVIYLHTHSQQQWTLHKTTSKLSDNLDIVIFYPSPLPAWLKQYIIQLKTKFHNINVISEPTQDKSELDQFYASLVEAHKYTVWISIHEKHVSNKQLFDQAIQYMKPQFHLQDFDTF